jgi:ABC-type Fe3+-hydroxamate transport system substrate-binding protein
MQPMNFRVELSSGWMLLGLIANARLTLLHTLLRVLLSACSARISNSTGVVASATIRHQMMETCINTVERAVGVAPATSVAASTGVALAVVASHLAVEGVAPMGVMAQ